MLEELACARWAGDSYLKLASLYPEDNGKHPSKFPDVCICLKDIDITK